MNLLARLFEEHKFVRRTILVWACWLITLAVMRATEPEVLPILSGPAATVVVAVIGILATVITFYMWSRNAEDLLVKGGVNTDAEQP